MLHERTFGFELAIDGPYAVVGAEGELDIAAVDALALCVERAACRMQRVVVDLREVTFMDTFALRTLVALHDEASGSDEWSLHVLPGAGIQRLLDVADARGALRWISPEQLVR